MGSQDDYQRMMMGQQSLSGGPGQGGFNPQMQGNNWQQQQAMQQMAQSGQSPGFSGSPGAGFGMSSSPPGQNWQGGPGGGGLGGGYPFNPGMHQSSMENLRHSSATPVSMTQAPSSQQNSPPGMDQGMTGDYDLFNWTAGQ
jgi:hypothetical protein